MVQPMIRKEEVNTQPDSRRCEIDLRILTQFEVRGWNDEDHSVLFGFPPVRIRCVNDAQGITFSKRQFLIGVPSIGEGRFRFACYGRLA
jgi:hypothetical protein